MILFGPVRKSGHEWAPPEAGSQYDLLIVGIAALTLIFAVMVIITRALVASLLIVGTVLLSLGAAFGLSVLVWQHLFGLELNWIAPAFGLIMRRQAGPSDCTEGNTLPRDGVFGRCRLRRHPG
jgi:uncharacterized membrane protein YdfJ with MMPL/SSD domain